MGTWQTVLTVVIGAVGGLISALLAFSVQKRKLRAETELQLKRLAEEFAVERSVESALRHFLSIDQVPYRSFQLIRHHIGGFKSNELR